MRTKKFSQLCEHELLSSQEEVPSSLSVNRDLYRTPRTSTCKKSAQLRQTLAPQLLARREIRAEGFRVTQYNPFRRAPIKTMLILSQSLAFRWSRCELLGAFKAGFIDGTDFGATSPPRAALDPGRRLRARATAREAPCPAPALVDGQFLTRSRVSIFGFGFPVFGLRFWGVGCRVSGFGFRVSGFGSRAYHGFRLPRFGVWYSGV